MANRQRDSKREAFWRQALTRFGKTGLSVRKFCQRERVTEASFYFWRRTIAERDRQQPRPAFVPLVVRQDQAPVAEPLAENIIVELRGGRILRLPTSVSADHLTTILRAVEAMP